MSKDVIERFQSCVKVCKVRKVSLGKKQDNANGRESNSDLDIELTPSDSVSQGSSGNSAASNSSIVARRIALERKRVELQSIEDTAKVKARKLRLLAEAEAEEAETLAKLRKESIKLETEEKLLACSERGSSVSTQTKTSKTKIALRPRVVSSLLKPSQPNQKAMNFTKRDVNIEVDAKDSGQKKTAISSFSGASHKTAE